MISASGLRTESSALQTREIAPEPRLSAQGKKSPLRSVMARVPGHHFVLLRLFERRGLLAPEAGGGRDATMEHAGGFSLDARSASRPPFATDWSVYSVIVPALFYAGERLDWVTPGQRLVYHLPNQGPFGQTVLHLTPLEGLDRVAALIPPPRRHRYHDVLAPNAPLRHAVTARAGPPWRGPPAGHSDAPSATPAREATATTPLPLPASSGPCS